MTLGNPYNKTELEKIKLKNSFCLVDKNETPERFKKSILLMMSTKQAQEIKDFLTKQIEQYPDDNVGLGLLVHTGDCA